MSGCTRSGWVSPGLQNPRCFFRNRDEHMGMGLKDLVTERDCMRLVSCHILKESADSQMRRLFALKLRREREGRIGTGRSGSSSTPCTDLGQLLKKGEFLRKFGGQEGRAGIGFQAGPRKAWLAKGKRGERRMATVLCRQEHEERRLAKLYGLGVQNGWMKWGMLEELRGEQITAEKMLFTYSGRLLSFTLNSTLNTLPTPDNLCRWGKHDEPAASCGLCGKKGAGLGHILGGCRYVLDVENKVFLAGGAEDRYTWRHNNVLRCWANGVLP